MRRSLTRPGQILLAALMSAVLLLPACSKKPPVVPSDCETSGFELLAFSSDRATAGQYDIYLYDLDPANPGFHLLSGLNDPAAADSNPTVSPDARFVAFVSARNDSASRLYLYDRGTCAFADMTTINSGGAIRQPAFTGDGTRLVFVKDTLGVGQIRMIQGTVPPRYISLPGLTAPGVPLSSPTADVHGDLVAFASTAEGLTRVNLYDRAVSGVRELPGLGDSTASDVDPALSEDGHWLVFASNRPDTIGTPGNFNIYLYDLQGDSLVALPGLNSAADERHPSISRTGGVIAFQSDRTSGNGWDLFLYVRSTQALVPELSKAGNDVQPWLVWP